MNEEGSSSGGRDEKNTAHLRLELGRWRNEQGIPGSRRNKKQDNEKEQGSSVKI